MIQNLNLPGEWNVPAKLLVSTLIRKRGRYVDSVSVKLAISCFRELDRDIEYSDFSSDEDRDGPYKGWAAHHKYKHIKEKNDRIRDRMSDDEDNVSPDTLISVLEHCPNLQALEVESPNFVSDEDDNMIFEECMANLIQRIHPLISKLTKLRSLTWHNEDCPEFPLTAFVQFIDQTPLLESLSFNNLSAQDHYSKDSADAPLGKHISQLNHLCNLRLEDTVLDDSWYRHSWTQNLKTPKLVNCCLTPLVAHRFVHLFASSLTQLKLSGVVSEPGKNELVQHYLLPALTDLHIQYSDGDLITMFDKCENVQRFDFTEPSQGDWESIFSLLLAKKWPRQERIQVEFYEESWTPMVTVYVNQMKKLSQDSGFVFEVI